MSHRSVSVEPGSRVKPFTRPTIPNREDWEAFRGIITYLYQECDLRLQDVIDVMLHDFNFRATRRMYTQRLRQWNIAKNIGSHDVQEYLQGATPAGLTSPNGTALIMLRGRKVPRRRLFNHLKRRKIATEPWLDGAEAVEENLVQSPRLVTTEDILEEDQDEPHARKLKSMGEEPYQNFESASEIDEMHDGLTSEELTSLSVAMLQTDFHYRRNDEDTPTEPRARTDLPVGHPSTTFSPQQSLAGPQELCDLEFVLYQSNIVYGQFPNAECPSPQQPFQLSARQQCQAKDFYARHWLAIRLLSKSVEKSNVVLKLLDQTCAQVSPILEENHPHLLPWIAFVVCYPGTFSHSTQLQKEVLNFTLGISACKISRYDPRRQVQQRLASSKFRRSICLVMLRQVISIFRRQIQQSHLDALGLLAQLFDKIEAHDDFDGDVVDATLQRWASSSLDIANVIEADQKTAKMKAERKIFDPVHQVAAHNVSST